MKPEKVKVVLEQIKMNAKLYGTTLSRAFQLGKATEKFNKNVDPNRDLKILLFIVGGVLFLSVLAVGIIIYFRIGTLIDAHNVLANYITTNLHAGVQGLPIK